MSSWQDSAADVCSPWPRRCLIGTAIAAVLFFGFFCYGFVEPRDASRSISTTNCLRQLGYAMHDYHKRYGMFPPPYLADENGRPLHSWRVLLLPFLDQQDLYGQYDFSKPWDSPSNRALLAQMPDVYRDPRLASDDESLTTFQVIAAPGTMFDPYAGPIRLRDLKDGTAETLMAIENLGRPVPWTKPVDMNLEDLQARVPLYNAPRDYLQVLMADGSTRAATGIDFDQLQAAATRAGEEPPQTPTPP